VAPSDKIPSWQGFFAFKPKQPHAVMCPAFLRGIWPLALMGSVDRELIMVSGSRWPIRAPVSLVPSVNRLCHHACSPSHALSPAAPPLPTRRPAGGTESSWRISMVQPIRAFLLAKQATRRA
jgi:hypothetical protein